MHMLPKGISKMCMTKNPSTFQMTYICNVTENGYCEFITLEFASMKSERDQTVFMSIVSLNATATSPVIEQFSVLFGIIYKGTLVASLFIIPADDMADNIIKDRLCIRFLQTLTLCVKWWDYFEHNMGSSRCDYDTFMNNRPNRLDMENSMVLAGYKLALKVWEFQSYNHIYCALSVHDSHRVRKSLDGI